MNQVQIRQVPSKSLTNTRLVVGSWFPTGYYGHFRSKSRADLCDGFRRIARPDPPKKFTDRQHCEARTHLFSEHDNRVKFECDPLVRASQSGFGKRKTETKARGDFDPFLISWVPKTIDNKKFQEDIKISSYTGDFSPDCAGSKILSDTESITSSIPFTHVTSYSAVYKHGQPDAEISKQIRHEKFMRYYGTLTRRAKLQRTERSLNVATCLVWNDTNKEEKVAKTDDTTTHNILSAPLKPFIASHDTPITKQKNSYETQSLHSFKTSSESQFGMPILREHFRTSTKTPFPRISSCDQIHRHSMEHLITKYM